MYTDPVLHSHANSAFGVYLQLGRTYDHSILEYIRLGLGFQGTSVSLLLQSICLKIEGQRDSLLCEEKVTKKSGV